MSSPLPSCESFQKVKLRHVRWQGLDSRIMKDDERKRKFSAVIVKKCSKICNKVLRRTLRDFNVLSERVDALLLLHPDFPKGRPAKVVFHWDEFRKMRAEIAEKKGEQSATKLEYLEIKVGDVLVSRGYARHAMIYVGKGCVVHFVFRRTHKTVFGIWQCGNVCIESLEKPYAQMSSHRSMHIMQLPPWLSTNAARARTVWRALSCVGRIYKAHWRDLNCEIMAHAWLTGDTDVKEGSLTANMYRDVAWLFAATIGGISLFPLLL